MSELELRSSDHVTPFDVRTAPHCYWVFHFFFFFLTKTPTQMGCFVYYFLALEYWVPSCMP